MGRILLHIRLHPGLHIGMASALLLASAAAGFAHGGGLDAHGCHHNRIEGGYHCHRGPLAGRAFENAHAARLAEWLAGLLADAPGGTVRFGGGEPTQVVDGDSLEITRDGRAYRVRLKGIDAPEMDQTCRAAGGPYPCGEHARTALDGLIRAGGGVTCEVGDSDSYGRFLGVCRDAKGRDLNAAMVEAGWALAYRHYTEAYVPQEERARKAERGLWAGTFTAPWDWRHRR
jgi:endonuclease YncB( thermonuclease family)